MPVEGQDTVNINTKKLERLNILNNFIIYTEFQLRDKFFFIKLNTFSFLSIEF